MHWFDIVFVLLVAYGLLIGVVRGFIMELFHVLAVPASFYVVAGLHLYIQRFGDLNGMQPWLKAAVFAATFIGVYCVFYGIVRFFSKTINETPLTVIDRALGGMLGLIKGVLLGFVAVVVLLLFGSPELRSNMQHSYLVCALVSGVRRADLLMPEDYSKRIHATVHDADDAEGGHRGDR